MKLFTPVFILMFLVTSAAQAEVTPQHKLLKNATYVVEEVLSTPDVEVPQKLLSKAKAVIVFPTMIKAGFIGAMRYGKGVATVRNPKTGKWGPPSFVTTIGGSIGFQIGAQAVDLVLIVMTERGVNGLLKNQFTLGSDVAVTAGPVGRYAEAGVDVLFQGDVYSYSRSKGVFAGISLKGTVIKPNYKYNRQYYRTEVAPKDIMINGSVRHIPESSKRFMRDFNRMAPVPQNFRTLASLEHESKKRQVRSRPAPRRVQRKQTAPAPKPVRKPAAQVESKPLW